MSGVMSASLMPRGEPHASLASQPRSRGPFLELVNSLVTRLVEAHDLEVRAARQQAVGAGPRFVKGKNTGSSLSTSVPPPRAATPIDAAEMRPVASGLSQEATLSMRPAWEVPTLPARVDSCSTHVSQNHWFDNASQSHALEVLEKRKPMSLEAQKISCAEQQEQKDLLANYQIDVLDVKDIVAEARRQVEDMGDPLERSGSDNVHSVNGGLIVQSVSGATRSSILTFHGRTHSELGSLGDPAKKKTLMEEKVKKERERPRIQKVVRHHIFDVWVACLVFANAVMIGLEIDNEHVAGNYRIDTLIFFLAELFFVVAFTVELFLRLYAEGCLFTMIRYDLQWYCMDALLVLISWFEIGMSIVFQNQIDLDDSMTKFIKVLKLIRILRLLRVVRFLNHVRSIVLMIMGSMMSLFWLFVVLAMVTYSFALVLTDGATAWLSKNWELRDSLEYLTIHDEFSSVLRSMLTLFECICNGISWGDVGKRTQRIGPGYFMVFLWYLFFTTFSILNIVTGVFVDSAIQLAENDRCVAMEKVTKARAQLYKALSDLVKEMDADNNGCISLEEWEVAMMDHNVRAQLEAMGIAHHETLELFHLLDASGDGEVQVEEFLDGIARVKGGARSLDLHKVITYSRKILTMLEERNENAGPALSPIYNEL